jgi:hypothetical protein
MVISCFRRPKTRRDGHDEQNSAKRIPQIDQTRQSEKCWYSWLTQCIALNKRPHVPEAFLQLSPEEQASILQTSAGKLRRRAEHLEKDVWICWVLQALFTMPGRLPMAFMGGTSLSKVYGAIRRFSENVDVTVDYKSLGQSIDPFDAKTSRTAKEEFTELLRIPYPSRFGSAESVFLEFGEDFLGKGDSDSRCLQSVRPET